METNNVHYPDVYVFLSRLVRLSGTDVGVIKEHSFRGSRHTTVNNEITAPSVTRDFAKRTYNTCDTDHNMSRFTRLVL